MTQQSNIFAHSTYLEQRNYLSLVEEMSKMSL